MTVEKMQKIVLGITGGIAAYKSAELVRLFKKKGYEVKTIMTSSAREFITPLTFQTLSVNKVYCKMFDYEYDRDISHISLARWADFILIAPASANIIAKIANGIADDLLSTVCLASKVPVIIAPAMNEAMWLNPATQQNIETLKSRNIKIIGPDKGIQACGDNGPGRMLSPEQIVFQIDSIFPPLQKIFKGKKIMVTAGPTQESIDPVRFLTNHSSGKMGYAVAETAKKMGGEVTLVTGPVNIEPPPGIDVIKVKTAVEMYNAVMKNVKQSDIYISAAAVADYRPAEILTQKHKKASGTLEIKFERNPDIIAEVAKIPSPPFTVGFSAETENLEENADSKIKNKHINLVAANYVGKNRGFRTDSNEIVVLKADGTKTALGTGTKKELSEKLLKLIFSESKKLNK
ncbi:MAG: bifunctional phosphopantothenoylcysteine decarboxylase/phosphopantothenate--cysteine ligase CoaBC [Victivallales bacterium]|nr:bifunctional phosphopantothenoylcysteine decarboxylase/phosphopantothenate--cysteine ligase CoaBC [Victivallales bacterium]